MKISINQTEIERALSIVGKGVSTRSTLPVLSGVLVTAKGDEVVFQSTDLELSIQYTVSALVEEEGMTVVPGKLFTDIVKSLPDAAVTMECDENGAHITCSSSAFTVKTLNPDDFPSFPHVDVDQTIEVPFPTFSSMVRKVARVVSRDESRAILTGILVTVEGDVLKMVATDSYRLALAETTIPNPPAQDFQAVISGGFMSEIASLEKSEEPVSIALSENQIVITYLSTVFVNRRIEGNFPNYRQLLPSGYDVRIGMSKDALSAAVKRTSILGSNGSPVKFDINIPSQTVQLSSAMQDVGSALETVPCTGDGSDMEIAFNCAYVLDGLQAIGTDTVYLETTSPLKPGIFRADAQENFLYLVMPVRIS